MRDAKRPVSRHIDDNRRELRRIFAGCDDVVFEHFRFGARFEAEALVVYCKPLVQKMDHNILRTVLNDLVVVSEGEKPLKLKNVTQFFEYRGPSSRPYRVLDDYESVAGGVLAGKTVLFFDTWDKALAFDFYHVERRNVLEPANEVVIYGPRESTVEDLEKNIAMLRLRLPNPNFKVNIHRAGEHTKTRFMIAYLDDKVNRAALAELERRIEAMPRTELLDVSYLRSFIEDAVYSPFPQYRSTERPDVAVSALLEGKILLMADGSNTIYIAPTLFYELFQSPEDYYQRTIIASLIRVMRMIAFFIALTLPSFYIALTTFHPELIPTDLLLTILDAREGIPFPALVEAALMQFFFELLREAGVRLPRPIGSAVSIFGALIVGESAIQAGISSPIMIVVIALTGIASFSLPHYALAISLRILVFPLMLLATLWGGFGLMVGLIFIFLHLASLRSLGEPYLSPLAPFRPLQWTDVFILAPLRVRKKLAGGDYYSGKPDAGKGR